MVEDTDQSQDGRIGDHLVPMIETGSERRLVPHCAGNGTEDDGHPNQRGKSLAEADAGGRGENDWNREAQGKTDNAPVDLNSCG